MTDTLAAATSTTEEQVRRDDRAHVFHSWSAQALIDPLPIASAQGSYFTDYSGKRYLDFSSQLVNVNIGYQHPKLVAAIQEQAARLTTISPAFANDVRSEAARLIAELAPGDLDRVFFTNGGAEANENAIRMARLHTGRHKVLAAYRSYHGATAGSIALTGDPRRWPSEPGMPGVVRYWGPYPYRSAFHATSEAEESERALQHLRDLLMVEGAHTVAAVILDEIRSLPVEPFGLPPPSDPRLQRIAHALIAEPADERDLEQWARWAAVSSRTLSRRFVVETGFNFTAWRQRARMMRSLEMLAAGVSVTAIALDLGYSTPSAFIGLFRRTFGETPASYRARL